MSKLKIGLAAVLLVWMLAPELVFAAATSPQFNPQCWKKSSADLATYSGDERDDPLSCLGARQRWLGQSDPTVADGWVADDACGGKGSEWGKCLPPGRTVTSIALGGMRTFSNIGDYIKQIYRIAISIAGILAAVVIIISGLEWTASGGNSEVIGRAKKRIGGAAVGLLLAFCSYLILNTINPALVNLRLPQTYMIRQMQMAAYWCGEYRDPTKFSDPAMWIKNFAEAGKSSEFIDRTKYQDKKDADFSFLNSTSTADSHPVCGMQYFPQGGGGATCYGDACVGADKNFIEDQMCFPPLKEDQKEYGCEKARMGVLLYSSLGEGRGCLDQFSSGWEWLLGGGWTPIINLKGVYSDGGEYQVARGEELSVDSDRKVQAFKIDFSDSDLLAAANRPGFVGFILQIALDDDCFNPIGLERYISKNGRDLRNLYNVSKTAVYSYQDLARGSANDLGGVFLSIDVGSISSNYIINSKANTNKQESDSNMLGGGVAL